MKSMRLDDTRSLGRALTLLSLIATDRGKTSFSTLTKELGLPTSTAHRLAAELLKHGLISRIGRGKYDLGVAAMGFARGREFNDILAEAARPILRQVSKETGLTAHLGVFEEGMVTYLVKSNGASLDQAHFTREGMQLEAYCSGVGKVLLASLSELDLDEYLSAEDFVSATPRTVTNSCALRQELARVRQKGMAIDDREIAEDMMCVAVPLHDGSGRTIAALSLSMAWSDQAAAQIPALSLKLTHAASRVGRNLGYA